MNSDKSEVMAGMEWVNTVNRPGGAESDQDRVGDAEDRVATGPRYSIFYFKSVM